MLVCIPNTKKGFMHAAPFCKWFFASGFLQVPKHLPQRVFGAVGLHLPKKTQGEMFGKSHPWSHLQPFTLHHLLPMAGGYPLPWTPTFGHGRTWDETNAECSDHQELCLEGEGWSTVEKMWSGNFWGKFWVKRTNYILCTNINSYIICLYIYIKDTCVFHFRFFLDEAMFFAEILGGRRNFFPQFLTHLAACRRCWMFATCVFKDGEVYPGALV